MESETAWEGAVSFSEEVYRAKETAEREREITSPLSPAEDAQGANGRKPGLVADMGKLVAQSIRYRPEIAMACPTHATRSRVRLF